MAVVSFEDAVERELANRDLNAWRRAAEDAEQEDLELGAESVIEAFLRRMAEAGNPGLQSYKWPRGRGVGSLLELLPHRRVRGWQLRSGLVITPDGRLFAKGVGSNIIFGETDAGKAFQHHYSVDGGSGPYTRAEIEQVFAPVLIDSGAV